MSSSFTRIASFHQVFMEICRFRVNICEECPDPILLRSSARHVWKRLMKHMQVKTQNVDSILLQYRNVEVEKKILCAEIHLVVRRWPHKTKCRCGGGGVCPSGATTQQPTNLFNLCTEVEHSFVLTGHKPVLSGITALKKNKEGTIQLPGTRWSSESTTI